MEIDRKIIKEIKFEGFGTVTLTPTEIIGKPCLSCKRKNTTLYIKSGNLDKPLPNSGIVLDPREELNRVQIIDVNPLYVFALHKITIEGSVRVIIKDIRFDKRKACVFHSSSLVVK